MSETATRWILTALIGVVAVAQFVQVFTRYVLEMPLLGIEEATVYSSLWLYMLGAANASRENSQIRANVLDIFLRTERARTCLAIAAESVSLAICGWLIYWAWDFTRYSWRTWRESPTLYWPTFYADVALLVGMVLVLAFTARTLRDHVRLLRNHSLDDGHHD